MLLAKEASLVGSGSLVVEEGKVQGRRGQCEAGKQGTCEPHYCEMLASQTPEQSEQHTELQASINHN